MSTKPARGRPSGSGKYGEVTRVARVPISMTNDELQSLIALRDVVLDIASAAPPYRVGSVRAVAYWMCQARILGAYKGLGLSLEPTMGRTVGLSPYIPMEK